MEERRGGDTKGGEGGKEGRGDKVTRRKVK
jgi:hypothetical protein